MSTTLSTTKSPLYPLTPTPVGFPVDLTFLTRTRSPTSSLCGCSVMIVTSLDATEQVLINPGFLLNLTLSVSIVDNESSASVSAPVILDSWITNPSCGSFAPVVSFGITNLSL